MPEWYGFHCWISIEGRDAEEYGVQTSIEDKTVTCWIASELGKQFQVHFRADWPALQPFHRRTTNAKFLMDGVNCGSKYTSPGSIGVVKSGTLEADGKNIRPFVFSTLRLTDDDAALGLNGSTAQANLNQLGVVGVDVYPVQVGGRMNRTDAMLPQLELHERTKKAVTQQIQLGTPEKQEKRLALRSVTRLGPDIVKFRFKYRPLDVLCANGIARPLEPKNKAATSNPKVIVIVDSDEEDVAVEVERLTAQLTAAKARMTARLSKPPDKEPRVKRESNDHSFCFFRPVTFLRYTPAQRTDPRVYGRHRSPVTS
ncbi:hypothetical protein MKEN_00728200 [Mycena kentingensis (nom. inval.)]|nr:hypothetical protein MKEN_00728200 [Mycena kentingensis (nom. inval.)]